MARKYKVIYKNAKELTLLEWVKVLGIRRAVRALMTPPDKEIVR